MAAKILEAAAEDAGESDFAHDITHDRSNVRLHKPPPQDEGDVRESCNHSQDHYCGVGCPAESPAVFRVTFTNVAAERTFWFPSVVPFTPLSFPHGSRSAELQLVPPNWRSGIDTNEDGNFEFVSDRPDIGCWQAADEIVFTAAINPVGLTPCETLSETFRIVGHPTNETCLPAGTYRTTSTWETSEEYGATSTGRREEWGLTFELSEG